MGLRSVGALLAAGTSVVVGMSGLTSASAAIFAQPGFGAGRLFVATEGSGVTAYSP